MTTWSPQPGFDFEFDDRTGLCQRATLGLVYVEGKQAQTAYLRALEINQAANRAIAEEADAPDLSGV